jgi:formylglycine-generating enzyme required for sulfatase activity
MLPRKVKDCDICPELIVIKAGAFDMGASDGDSDAFPIHRVSINSFLMGATEVTEAEWKAVMGINPNYHQSCGDNCAVSHISWNDAKIYVSKLSQQTGKKFRLPSEAEWEYAARAGSVGKWTFGDAQTLLAEHAWFAANSGFATHSVANKKANGYGLYDMHGNLWEWVEDIWHPNYVGAPINGSAWVTEGDDQHRVLRGGSWFDQPNSLKSSYRSWNTPVINYYGAGLRVARDF